MKAPFNAYLTRSGSKSHRWIAWDAPLARPKDYNLMRSRCGLVVRLNEIRTQNVPIMQPSCIKCGYGTRGQFVRYTQTK
jgi:hypothetical protein